MNLYLYKKHVVEHSHDLQCEAEQERMLADLHHSHQNLLRHTIGRLGVLLITLGTRSDRLEQNSEQVACKV